jgi:integrase
VKDNAIIWQTGKSRGRKSVVLPITDAVREVLDSLPRGDCPTVLCTSEGETWTPPGRGLDSGVQRARDEAEAEIRERGGADATSGLEGLRFHDLRGTAATNYILAGLPLDDVATILGWELKRVSEIARRYVTGEAIGIGMIARLEEARNRRPTVRPPVKPTPQGRVRRPKKTEENPWLGN